MARRLCVYIYIFLPRRGCCGDGDGFCTTAATAEIDTVIPLDYGKGFVLAVIGLVMHL